MVNEGVYDRIVKDKPVTTKETLLQSFRNDMPQWLAFLDTLKAAGFVKEQKTIDIMTDWIAETCIDTQSTEK